MNKFLWSIAAIGLGAAGWVLAQQPSFARIPVQTQDLSMPGKIAVQVIGEFEPGAGSGRHTHPGEELAYVLEGQIEVRIDGQPPRVVKAGEAFFFPAGVVHEGVNTGSTKTKVLATYIVEKGQPLATLAK